MSEAVRQESFQALRIERADDLLVVTIAHPASKLNAVDDPLHRDLTKLVKDALNLAFDTSIALELITFRSDDPREALAAIREKRAPKFSGR